MFEYPKNIKKMSYETSKAKPRRIREKFFEKYCQGIGIDIGCGPDPLEINNGLTERIDYWDKFIHLHMDASFMSGIPSQTYDFVYSSHCLEDVINPLSTIKQWYRILKTGGYLIIFVPDRDLYERKHTLPSLGNADHRHFFLIDRDEPPNTVGLVRMISEAFSPDYEFIYAKRCSDRVEIGNGVEYSIEVVIRKGNFTQWLDGEVP